MFGGDGAKHQHDGIDCECLDALAFFQQMAAARMPIAPEHQEPEKTPFPGLAIEEALRRSIYAPSLTVEDWLLGLWREIRAGVGAGSFGPAKITWADLIAYQSYSGLPLSDWLVMMILQIDALFLQNWKQKEK